jgi:hypothetical protein
MHHSRELLNRAWPICFRYISCKHKIVLIGWRTLIVILSEVLASLVILLRVLLLHCLLAWVVPFVLVVCVSVCV